MNGWKWEGWKQEGKLGVDQSESLNDSRSNRKANIYDMLARSMQQALVRARVYELEG